MDELGTRIYWDRLSDSHRLQQLEQPTVLVVLIVISHQLCIKLPFQQLTIDDCAFVAQACDKNLDSR